MVYIEQPFKMDGLGVKPFMKTSIFKNLTGAKRRELGEWDDA